MTNAIQRASFALVFTGALVAQQERIKPVKLHVWLKAFIPSSHPSNKDLVREHPKDQLGSIIKGPAWTSCFETDGRTFSSAPGASARLTAEFTVETDGKSAKVLEPLRVHCGPTHEVDCGTGEAVSTLTGLPGIKALGDPACADGKMQIVLQAAAANPRVPAAVSPWIDASMDLLFDFAKREVTCKATVGAFPAFEAYAEIDGKTWVIFQVEPTGNGPGSLFDLGTGVNAVPVNVVVELDPAKSIPFDAKSLADFVRVQGLLKPGETNEAARRRLHGLMDPRAKYTGAKEQNEKLLAWLQAKLDSRI